MAKRKSGSVKKDDGYRDSMLARYCFCSETPLWAERCKKCGKPPYTD